MMLSVNNNSKDGLILQLQKEISEMKQNEKDYQDLNFLLTNLEHRYNLLNEEKNKNEIDYESRIEMHLKTIGQLRTEKDEYKQSFHETVAELQQLKQLNQREFENLRDETNYFSNQNHQLKDNYDQQINEVKILKEEKDELAEEYQKINIYLEEALLKNQDMSNEIQQLKEEIQELKNSLKSCFEEIQNATGQIEEDSSLINQQQIQIGSLNNQIDDLQNQLHRANELSDHQKQQLNIYTESYQKEFQQNIELTSQIKQLEEQINNLETQINISQNNLQNYENYQQQQQDVQNQLSTEMQKHNTLQLLSQYLVLHNLDKTILSFNEISNLIEQTKIISSARLQFENEIKTKFSSINGMFQQEEQKSKNYGSPKGKIHSVQSQVILNASKITQKAKEQYNLAKRPSVSSSQDISKNNQTKSHLNSSYQYQTMKPSQTSQYLMKKINNKKGLYNSFNQQSSKIIN